jgi:RimJ/RimL family protein N-acetyltransferase
MVTFRKLTSDDLQAYRDHLLRLPDDDRYSRFCGTGTPTMVEEHCRRLNWRWTTVIGAFDDGALCGVVELYRDNAPGFRRHAELAVSVEHPFQHRGIGRILLRRIMTVARNRMVGTVHVVCLPDNRKMRGLAIAFGGRAVVDDGQLFVTISLSPPDKTSLMLEAADDGSVAVAAVLDAGPANQPQPAVRDQVAA